MPFSTDEPSAETVLSPDEAFSVLGNDTRIGILQALGEADGPLSFTELRDRVGVRQGAQFNYHLDKTVGHFVAKTDEGYVLRQPGRRVIQMQRGNPPLSEWEEARTLHTTIHRR